MTNQNKPDAIEVVTSVDAYGDISSSQILHPSYILVYSNGPNGHVVVGELKGKMERLAKLEAEHNRLTEIREWVEEYGEVIKEALDLLQNKITYDKDAQNLARRAATEFNKLLTREGEG